MGAVWSALGGERVSRRQGAFYKAYKINDALGQKLISVGIGKKQLYDLHQIFNVMDKDSSGEINLMEFFDYIDLKRTRFSEKAFSVMDRDGSGEVDFIEFVLAVWNYCSFSRASLVRYAFDLYDSDGSGEIELAEASLCVREIWGSEWERNANAQKVMAKIESIMRSTVNGRMTVKMFEDFSQTHPMLLFPAFQLQTEIQQRVLGERFWLKAAKRRSLIDPKELEIKHIEKLIHLSRATSNKFLQSVGTELHDNVFEEVNATPQPQRKRSSLVDLYLKARDRTAKVFLSANHNNGDLIDVTESSATQQTAVTTFESSKASPASDSPTAKKTKPATSPKRPPPVETMMLPLANHSQSSFASATAITSSVSNTPTNTSPKKKKKKAKPTTGSPDLVVEDVADAHT